MLSTTYTRNNKWNIRIHVIKKIENAFKKYSKDVLKFRRFVQYTTMGDHIAKSPRKNISFSVDKVELKKCQCAIPS